MKFWKATLETRSFLFEAYGMRKSDALMAIGEAMRIHEEQYSPQADWATMDDVQFKRLKMDTPYRDNHALPR